MTCLDAALNDLLHGDELHDTLAGIARQLAPGGLAVWDINTLSLVRASFAGDWIAERGEWFVCWRGTATPAVAAGAVVEARVDAFRRRGSSWTRTTSRHRQRHWPLRELLRAAEAVGLDVLRGARAAALRAVRARGRRGPAHQGRVHRAARVDVSYGGRHAPGTPQRPRPDRQRLGLSPSAAA